MDDDIDMLDGVTLMSLVDDRRDSGGPTAWKDEHGMDDTLLDPQDESEEDLALDTLKKLAPPVHDQNNISIVTDTAELPDDTLFLIDRLRNRGYESIIPSSWSMGMRTLPNSLFTTVGRDAYIRSLSGRDTAAEKAVTTLFQMGQRGRAKACSPNPQT